MIKGLIKVGIGFLLGVAYVQAASGQYDYNNSDARRDKVYCEGSLCPTPELQERIKQRRDGGYRTDHYQRGFPEETPPGYLLSDVVNVEPAPQKEGFGYDRDYLDRSDADLDYGE